LNKEIFPTKLDHKFISAALFSLAWAGVAAMALKTLTTPIFDPDLWWHLAAGRQMVEMHTILKTDIFSHSMYGLSWINFDWFGEVLIYLVVKWFGFGALYWGKFLLAAGSLTALFSILRARGLKGPSLCFLTEVGFFILRGRLFDRFELVTLVLLPVFIFILLEGRRLDPSRRRNASWLLFGLMIAWVNIHPGFAHLIGRLCWYWFR